MGEMICNKCGLASGHAATAAALILIFIIIRVALGHESVINSKTTQVN
jgi:hypothetical protein